MDSLTQITLGAAVGELVLGKKIGNRAILWGAVGGTIPDLDVLTGLFLDPLQELTAHRGFSHSIVFSIIGAFVFGWMIHRMYQSAYHRYMAVVGWFMIPAGVLFFISRIFEGASFSAGSLALFILVIGLSVFGLYKRYFQNEVSIPEASLRDWQWLMFWTIFTHPLLDCFTTYGTQLFQPFSDYRVAFNVISVADPLYTLPFLTCVIALSFLSRERKIRRRLAWTGIAISTCYLMLCTLNKQYINKVWKETLQEDGIAYSRFMTSPSILNNILWTCIAETEDGYVHGQFSLFDKVHKVKYEFTARNPSNSKLREDDYTLDRLKWFSNNYYSVSEHELGLQFNDLRFGSSFLENGKRHYIFNFILKNGPNGSYVMLGANGGPPPGGEEEMMKRLIERIKGV